MYSSLPAEILNQIFRLLCPWDLIMAVQVCRRWKEIGEDPRVWTQDSVRVTRGNLEMLDIGGLQHLQNIWVANDCDCDPECYCWENVRVETLLRVVERLPKLRKILFTAISAGTQIKKFHIISESNLSRIERVTSPAFKEQKSVLIEEIKIARGVFLAGRSFYAGSSFNKMTSLFSERSHLKFLQTFSYVSDRTKLLHYTIVDQLATRRIRDTRLDSQQENFILTHKTEYLSYGETNLHLLWWYNKDNAVKKQVEQKNVFLLIYVDAADDKGEDEESEDSSDYSEEERIMNYESGEEVKNKEEVEEDGNEAPRFTTERTNLITNYFHPQDRN